MTSISWFPLFWTGVPQDWKGPGARVLYREGEDVAPGDADWRCVQGLLGRGGLFGREPKNTWISSSLGLLRYCGPLSPPNAPPQEFGLVLYKYDSRRLS